jgi:hypothetical protein
MHLEECRRLERELKSINGGATPSAKSERLVEACIGRPGATF